MLYGCGEAARSKLVRRPGSWGFAAYHPLMLPTIFAEVERERHFHLVGPLITKLVGRVEALDVADEQDDPRKTSDGRSSTSSESSSQENGTSEAYMRLWLEISWLKNGLENWKRELQKMIAHCEELRRAEFHIPDRDFGSSTESTPVNAHYSGDTFYEQKGGTCSQKIKEVGDLEVAEVWIRKKLTELEGEYDEKIRACTTVIDGMALAAQLVSRHSISSVY